MRNELIITERLHSLLHKHLHPGDGKEAVALVGCGTRVRSDGVALLAREIYPIPYEACVRTPESVTWPTSVAEDFLDHCAKERLAVVKIHSHPTGARWFSSTDDKSDRALFPSIHGWIDGVDTHASAIMLPSGEIIGRFVSDTGDFQAISVVKFVGHDLHFWYVSAVEEEEPSELTGAAIRLIQSFGEGTYRHLRRLKIGIVGLSGIGSILAELLARNCVGNLVLVEPDIVEHKNLTRMLNSTKAHADGEVAKTIVIKEAIERMGLGTKVDIYTADACTRDVVLSLSTCDVVFGGMDSIYGRHLLNRLATYYLIPYFDAGVRLEADGKGGIDSITAAAHYLQPDGSSLLSRGVYTAKQLEADGIRVSDPKRYKELLKEGYIKGVREDRPAVISVNTIAATLAVNDFLARLHPYRDSSNSDYAAQFFRIDQGFYYHEDGGTPSATNLRNAGRGDVEPLLDRPDLSQGVGL